MRAAQVIDRNVNRRAFSSPACGPVPVTTVPATMRQRRPHDHQPHPVLGPRRDGADPLGVVGLASGCTSTTAMATSTIDRTKCSCTAIGLRSVHTTMAPTMPWAGMPATSAADSTQQVTTARTPQPCAQRGKHHRQPDDEGEHPVDLFDRRVLRRHVDEASSRCSSASRCNRAPNR